MTDSAFNRIIEMINEEIADCGEPDISARPIAYGSILGLKMAKAIVQTIVDNHEEYCPACGLKLSGDKEDK
jgi:hypothetical protein